MRMKERGARRAMIPDVVSLIMEEMQIDTENQSKRLLQYYNEASDEGKNIISEVLMCLCGWTFPTIVSLAKERGMMAWDE